MKALVVTLGRMVAFMGFVAVVAACSDNASQKPKEDEGPPPREASVPPPREAGVPGPEAGTPAKDQGADGCDPGCHWDCLTPGPMCQGGKIYFRFRAPVPCCKYGDPWSGPEPQCTSGIVHASCPAGDTCRAKGTIDTRYACMVTFEGQVDDSAPAPTEDQLRLWCSSVGPRSVGDACTSDADCRPAAAPVTSALGCDQATKKCVTKPLPAEPSGYLGSCGLSGQFNAGVKALGSGKELCVAEWDAAAGCLKQAKTIRCSFDEDCPAGSSCACGSWTGSLLSGPTMSYCRPDGLTLVCPGS